jgi:xylulose-5-phosphate/fructose-6-phosphate phosphoketolase
MCVLNEMDRFHLVLMVIRNVPAFGPAAAHAAQHIQDRLYEHTQFIRQHGDDMPEIRDWRWPGRAD